MKNIYRLIIILGISLGYYSFAPKLTPESIKLEKHELIPENNSEKSYDGIYEYVYEHNTESLTENHYLEIQDSKILYYGTSDDFDLAREGYYPGFFSKRVEILEKSANRLTFRIKVNNSDFFERPKTPFMKYDNNPKWTIGVTENMRLYEGEIKGNKIIIKTDGFETRVFVKK